MKQNHLIIIILSSIFILLIIPCLFDLILTPDVNVVFRDIKVNEKNMLCICDIPLTSQAYKAGLEIGDTVELINNTHYKNFYDLKKRLFYQKSINDTIVFTVINGNNIKTIPIVLLQRNPIKRSLFMIFVVFFTFIVLLFFLHTFPNNRKFAFIVFVFYLFILLSYIYAYVSFEKPLLYSILIFAASFSPCFPILMSLNLLKTNNLSRKHYIIPFSFSSLIFVLWCGSYIKWAIGFDSNSLNQYSVITQFAQGLVGIMILIGISGISFAIISRIRKSHEIYVPIALLLIFLGFIPYLTLYALPLAFGLHEIVSIDITLSFIILPLLGLVLYNKFIYE